MSSLALSVHAFWTVPNVLSLLRLPLAALFVAVGNPSARALVLIVVAFTDFADGWIARRLRQEMRPTGQLLDPLTDKMFVLVALTTLLAESTLGIGTAGLLLMRDIYTALAFFLTLALRWRARFRARLPGKIVTALQLSVVLALLLWPAAVAPLIVATVVASVAAIIDYTQAGLAQRRQAQRTQR